MLVPLSWIRDFTPVDAPVPDLVSALNQLGLEVEGVEQPGAEITGVRVARVLGVEKHPDADKLKLVDIDTGVGQTRVVCGAPTWCPGWAVPYAGSGATLPWGFCARAAQDPRCRVRRDALLRQGVGLGDDHSGILGLDDGTELGADVRAVLGLDDVIFDLAITPNRPDAMCVVGVARELAAHFSLPLDVPEPNAPVASDLTNPISVVIEDDGRCPRYLGQRRRRPPSARRPSGWPRAAAGRDAPSTTWSTSPTTC